MSSEMGGQLAGQAAAQMPPADPEGLWQRFKDGLRWLVTYPSRLSTPARAAWILFFVLILLVGVAWTLFWLDENNGPWRHLLSPQWVAIVAVLAVVIPFVAYRGLRLWLEGDASLYPEVDYAWKAGLEALDQHGIRLENTPIYLIIGSSGEEMEEALINAAGRRLRVSCVPEGPAPLHWYANPDAIYLFASDASWLSGMASLKERRRVLDRGPTASLTPQDIAEVHQAAAEPVTPAPAPAPAPTPVASGADTAVPSGTIMLDQFVAQRAEQTERQQVSEQQAAAPAPAEARSTMSSSRLTMAGDFVSTTSDQGPAVLPSHEANQRSQQLEYLCQLLSRARAPVCPINGIVTLLPFELVKGLPAETEQLQAAIQSDLKVMQRELKVRCPVTCLVSGLEHERGFRELVRRVGREMAGAQRFGQKFDICNDTSPDQISALSAHVCGAFEDWIYTLFREEDALTRAGNTRLYGLLCKVRCVLKMRLTQVLLGGFGHDPKRGNNLPIAFSGCYFAATGATSDRQAFVRGIFDKLHAEQESVEWSKPSLDESRWYRRAATFGMLLNAALVIVAISMIVMKFN